MSKTGIQFDKQFKEWLASAPTDGVQVDTLEIFHPRWQSIYLARWKTPFQARIETGEYITFTPADFAIEQLPVENGTGQTIRAMLNGLDGAIYEELKALTFEDRATTILVTYRLYLDNLAEFPLIDPPPVLEVSLANCERDIVTLELSPSALPNILCGRYYLINDFPGLKEV